MSAYIEEFYKLYTSLFEKPDEHIAIIKCLGEKKSGLTQTEIIKQTKLSSGGSFTRTLRELESSGFILATQECFHKKKSIKYRLVDEYSLFYLSWIEPASLMQFHNIAQHYWLQVQNSQAYLAWAGYAFAGICLKHVDKIIDALKLTVVASSYAAWTYKTKDADKPGAQIDLVIDRRDRSINLCEIKFCQDVFRVTKDYAINLRYKKSAFAEQTKTKKSLFTTLITAYGSELDQHYLSAVDNQVTMDSLFT